MPDRETQWSDSADPICRDARLERASSEQWDVMVIGAGASGLGCALASVRRGLRTLLIDQSDLAKGTSSRSTKLIHGGVRYLRQGRLRLVRQALAERERLLHVAPHLVHRLDHLVPVQGWVERVWMSLGFRLYDSLAASSEMGPSSFLSLARTKDALGTLKPSGFTGSIRYSDAQFDDARLAVSLLRTIESLGGLSLTYARLEGFLKAKGKIAGAMVSDVETGNELAIRATVVINATGVFSDEVRSMAGPLRERRVLASQGTHIVLDAAWMPSSCGLLIPKTRDGRVLFVLPWNGVLLAGTTDVPISQPALEPKPTSAEISYILDHLKDYLEPAPGPDDCLSCFAGLRPLIRRGRGESTASLSREHLVEVDPSGLVSLLGGKWTTFRVMGEEAVDTACRVGGLRAGKVPGPLERLIDTPAEAAPTRPPADPMAVYGADASRVRELEQDDQQLQRKLHPDLPCLASQVVWAVRMEQARCLEDVLSRRIRCLILNARASVEAAPAVASLMAQQLNRDAEWQRKQVESYTRLAQSYLVTGLESPPVND